MSKNFDEHFVLIVNENKSLSIENVALKKRIAEAKRLIADFSLHKYVWESELSIKSHDELYEFLHDKLDGVLGGNPIEDAQDVLKKMEDMG